MTDAIVVVIALVGEPARGGGGLSTGRDALEQTAEGQHVVGRFAIGAGFSEAGDDCAALTDEDVGRIDAAVHQAAVVKL